MNDQKPIIKTVTLAYFSGTGGTKSIVNCFEAQFVKADISVTSLNIPKCNTYHDITASDLIILFSPVYAFRLASIVERFAKYLPQAKNTLAAVISVSGAGDVSPNSACRLHCKHLLMKKGYHLIYEKMLVMPSNFAVQASSSLNTLLIHAMPKKAEQIVTEILSGQVNLTQPYLIDHFFAFIGYSEHFGAKVFGLFLRSSKACTQCGLCERTCPTNNIKIKNGIPRFGFHCIWCLKCVYQCPVKAISPQILKFSVLKNGYNIEKMKKQANSQQDIEYEFCKNILWQGVIDYLKE